MDAQAFLQRLAASRDYRGQITAVRNLPARTARFADPQQALPARLKQLLAAEGIERLFQHQADAFDAVRRGEHVVIATGTASGKSLCYHLPVFAALLDDPECRALYLYPAKALAYDQLGNLERMVVRAGLADIARPACYDGDTPTHKRPGIRRSATILLTNPDMLHKSILPYNPKWAGFFARLRYVVLDEVHTYRGIFGSHVAGVVRRLQRLCRHYGSDPVFICSSATVGNPCQLAETLTNRTLRLIDDDASPRGCRWYVLWNPPWQDETRVARRSGNVEAQALMQALLEADAGTIAFGRARIVAELLYKYLVDALERRRPDLARRVKPYRGGYLPQERREIEQALFSGQLKGVCSTNALELGIDVGALDASILVGFPGTLCSFWQQSGRAGRRQEESLSIYVAYDDPIDQYLMRNPDFIFRQPLEHALADPTNPHILAAQLACAAAEMPLQDAELADFGPTAREVANELAQEGRLHRSAGAYHHAESEAPSARTNLRMISDATYAIVDQSGGEQALIGQVDSISAPELVYPGAIYLHQGDSYIVREYDQQARIARVERGEVDYYTQPILSSDCRIVAERLQSASRGARLFFGDVIVRWRTVAFRKFKFYSTECIGQTTLDLPPQQINTKALWIQPPAASIAAALDTGQRAIEALVGVRNLLQVALPPLAMCDRADIGGQVDSSQLGAPTIIVYDRYEGGVGYARHGFACVDELLRIARAIVAGCECESGCPGCVGPTNLRPAIHHDPDLYRSYDIPDKRATAALLSHWLATPTVADAPGDAARDSIPAPFAAVPSAAG